jgi:DNA polymerase family A
VDPLLGLLIPSATGGDDVQMGIVLAITAMGLDDHDITTLESAATDPAIDSIQTAHTTAHKRTQHRLCPLIKRFPEYRRHGQDDMTVDDALMEHLTDLADPGVDVDFGTAQAQRRFTAHRHPMSALPTLQTAVLDIAHRVGIPTPEHLVHETVIVALIIARVDALKPVPVLGKDLFEDAPGWWSCCNHQTASLRSVGWCVVGLFYHVQLPTSTPLSACTASNSALRSPLRHGAIRAIRKWKFLDDQDTFRDMAHAYPIVNPMRELRASLSQLRLEQLAVGQDGRNRAILSAFRAKTGRNAPSTTRFIFGPAVWLRHLIRPEPGYGVAYIDYEQQEFGIAAALSGDVAMQQAYASADPYLSFAKQAGAVPPDATRSTHSAERERFKACVLAVQYGMGAESLAYRIGQTPAHARALLRAHRQTYARFWQWIEGAVDYAMLTLELHTVFGWTLHVEGNVNPRTFSNFPMQSNGSEMLRLACSLATERGIEVCAPVHDAVLIHAPREELPHAIALTQQCMQQASEAVLAGYRLRTEAKSFLFPEHYQDARGAEMWQTVKGLLTSICGALRETEILVSI